MADLVTQTHESSSMAQLDGSDIVYVAPVAVPKIIALRVSIGTRFPALPTSQGKVLLADIEKELMTVRAQGWALADEELAPGVRSVAVPVRDGTGRVRAAMNVTVHAAETSVDTLVSRHLPRLLRTAGAVSADWTLWMSRPHIEIPPGQAA